MTITKCSNQVERRIGMINMTQLIAIFLNCLIAICINRSKPINYLTKR